MKTLTLNQMENITAGSLKKTLTCVSQVAGGMDVLWSAAAVITFGATPVGLIILGFGVASFIASAVADPNACD